ncbi:MAG: type II toxin-antitoxin system VapC family toxin [Candidatus Micrarchaeota archaeon]|nr:type II toxin-antitoxin system VapC family toxin [Candidatus Micrarchaeota archaeon]
MKVFLDSSVIIEFLRNNKKVVQQVAEASEIYTSSICAYEVLVGEKYLEEKGQRSHFKETAAFFDRIGTVPFSFSDAAKAAEIAARLTIKGKKVDEIDILIAAQALSHNAQFLTMDSRHFEIISAETGLALGPL